MFLKTRIFKKLPRHSQIYLILFLRTGLANGLMSEPSPDYDKVRAELHGARKQRSPWESRGPCSSSSRKHLEKSEVHTVLERGQDERLPAPRC